MKRRVISFVETDEDPNQPGAIHLSEEMLDRPIVVERPYGLGSVVLRRQDDWSAYLAARERGEA